MNTTHARLEPRAVNHMRSRRCMLLSHCVCCSATMTVPRALQHWKLFHAWNQRVGLVKRLCQAALSLAAALQAGQGPLSRTARASLRGKRCALFAGATAMRSAFIPTLKGDTKAPVLQCPATLGRRPVLPSVRAFERRPQELCSS